MLSERQGTESVQTGTSRQGHDEDATLKMVGIPSSSATHQIFKHHVPADDESYELAYSDVRVHVGGAGGVWYPHAELCVAGTWTEVVGRLFSLYFNCVE